MQRRTWRIWFRISAALAGLLTVLIVVSMFIGFAFADVDSLICGSLAVSIEAVPWATFDAGGYPTSFAWGERLAVAFEAPRLDLSIPGPALILIPLVWPMLLFAGVAWFCWWRGRPMQAGYCARCGYNLTGNVSGTCPECGRPVDVSTN